MRSWVGMSERGGKNRGLIMDSANRFCGVPLGSSYCASTGSLAIFIAGGDKPKSPLAMRMKTEASFSAFEVIRGAKKIHEGDGLVWQKGKTVYGHFGFANADWRKSSGPTVEANTSFGTAGNQSNGDGIYIRWRSLSPTSYFRIVTITPIEYE